MKKTFIGFNHGQYGDLFIGLTAASVLKQKYPESRLIYSINKKFSDCKEIFLHSDHIDDIIVWDKYDDWPGEQDVLMIQNLIDVYGKNLHVFDPNAKHKEINWYLHRHQTTENCLMHNLPEPSEDQMDFSLNTSGQICRQNYITIAPLTSFGSPKNLTHKILEKVQKFALQFNLPIVQLGGPNDSTIEGATKFNGTYFESVKVMLSSRFLISADTGMIWAASAYNHPVIGFYGYSFYPGATTAINWQPKNHNQISMESHTISDIDLSDFYNILEYINQASIRNNIIF
jgi:ADP-heptose:LPS heptosyltransferase